NNKFRMDILNYAKELDTIRREAKEDAYRLHKELDDLKLVNLKLKAEHGSTLKQLDNAKLRLEEVAKGESLGKVSSRISSPLQPSSGAFGRQPDRVPQAKIELVDLSSRRIAALEEEVSFMESKLDSIASQLRQRELEVEERNLEIARLNAQIDQNSAGNVTGSDPIERLNDQVDYLQEKVEALEKENAEQRQRLAKEKEELHNRWINTENERVKLDEQVKELSFAISKQQPQKQPGDSAASSDQLPSPRSLSASSGAAARKLLDISEVEQLRTENTNIKSLYNQTREQLQDLLRSGNAELKQAQKQATETQQRLQEEVDKHKDTITTLEAEVGSLKDQMDKTPEYQILAKEREKQISRLERKIAKLSNTLENEQQSNRQTVGDLTRQMEDIRSELLHKGDIFTDKESQYNQLLQEYNGLIEQHRKLDRNLKQAVQEVSEWRAKSDEKDYRLSDLTRKVDEYRLQHKQSSSELRALKRTLDNYTRDLNTLRDSHSNDQREIGRLYEELEQLGKLKKAIEMSKDDYKRQLAKSLDESDSHRSLISHLQSERNALRVQVKAQFHLSQRLEQRLEFLDPNYSASDQTLRASGTRSSLSSASSHSRLSGDVYPPRHRVLSRSSSAAHSSRSFEDIPSSRARLSHLPSSAMHSTSSHGDADDDSGDSDESPTAPSISLSQ
ncbi:hypothetical protein GGI12_003182, partial [Dipsacomyces acuminosporus]